MTILRRIIFEFFPSLIRDIFVNKLGVWFGFYDWCSGCSCAYPKDEFKDNEYCDIKLSGCPTLDKYRKRTYGVVKAAQLKEQEYKLSPQEWGVRADIAYQKMVERKYSK